MPYIDHFGMSSEPKMTARHLRLLDWWQSNSCVVADVEAPVLTMRTSDPYGVWPADATDNDAVFRHRYLTVKEAAKLAGVCELTIRRAYRANQLRVQPLGQRGVRIHMNDLLDWMARGSKTKLDIAA